MTVRIASAEDKKLNLTRERVDLINNGKVPKTGVSVKDNLTYDGESYTSGSVDISYLDTPSLDRFMRSKGGRNDLAEDIVKKLLKHPAGPRQE